MKNSNELNIAFQDFAAAEQSMPFLIRIRAFAGRNFFFGAVNQVTGERLTIELYENELHYIRLWIIGRLPGDCLKSACELFNDINNPMETLAHVEILL